MIGKEIRNILINDTDVAAMVSTRVYSDLRPQTNNTVPAIVYRIGDKRREHSQDPAGVDFYRVELAIYGSTYAQIQELDRRIENALDRYPIGTIINNYIIDGVIHEESEDDPYDIDENGLRNKLSEYQVRIKIYNIAMNYSLTEQDTGDTWIDGSAVYVRTFSLGLGAGANVALTGLTKTWTLLPGKSEFIQAPFPTTSAALNVITQGSTDYQILLDSNFDTPNYYVAYYIKSTIT